METKIGDLLENYDIEAPERTVERVAAEVVSNIIGADIATDSVRYQQGTLWVDTDPLSRSQIHLHQEKIRKTITEKIDDRRIDDIQ